MVCRTRWSGRASPWTLQHTPPRSSPPMRQVRAGCRRPSGWLVLRWSTAFSSRSSAPSPCPCPRTSSLPLHGGVLGPCQGNELVRGHGLSVFQSQFGAESVSADKLITLARAQNATVLTLTSPNAPELAALPVAQATRAELRSWLQSGYSVEIPAQSIAHAAWRGMGWVVSDPATGASGYFLSGGIAGGATVQSPWTLQFLTDALAGAHTDAANNDPSSG